ncbi:unnamed protein product [Calicophoron daubneyi]|uniref:Uncharacterized protein n=1 Tax=Calicophoron daubneyi TaxID=300641 RepID=A0AAV2TG08_CALDB
MTSTVYKSLAQELGQYKVVNNVQSRQFVEELSTHAEVDLECGDVSKRHLTALKTVTENSAWCDFGGKTWPGDNPPSSEAIHRATATALNAADNTDLSPPYAWGNGPVWMTKCTTTPWACIPISTSFLHLCTSNVAKASTISSVSVSVHCRNPYQNAVSMPFVSRQPLSWRVPNY